MIAVIVYDDQTPKLILLVIRPVDVAQDQQKQQKQQKQVADGAVDRGLIRGLVHRLDLVDHREG